MGLRGRGEIRDVQKTAFDVAKTLSSRLLPRRPPPLLRPIQGREDRSKTVEPLLLRQKEVRQSRDLTASVGHQPTRNERRSKEEQE